LLILFSFMGVDMKSWTNKLFLSLLGAVVAVAVSVSATDVEAKRMGGGKSVGKSSQTTQKDAAPANNASSTNTAPAASAAATKAPAAAPAAAASNRSKWLGPLAGLAAGLGLAALASHLGFGEGFANIMMIMLFAMIAFAAFKFFMARRAQAAGGKTGRVSSAGLTPAYAGASSNQTAYQASMPAAQTPSSGYSGGIGSGLSSSQIERLASIPGFDEAGFVRQAKVYFVRLQAAYDVGNKQDLREFTSPEMFAELMMEINERNGQANRTEIERLDAEFLGQGADSDFQHVSVRFFGMVKEFEGAQTNVDAKAINETWNFAKPLSGAEGWTLVGIEQN
jgi:predicted lipid-binding transport protein (Tim44 family)